MNVWFRTEHLSLLSKQVLGPFIINSAMCRLHLIEWASDPIRKRLGIPVVVEVVPRVTWLCAPRGRIFLKVELQCRDLQQVSNYTLGTGVPHA